MASEIRRDIVELEQPEHTEDAAAAVVKRDGVFRVVLRGLFWPFGLVMRGYRWVLGSRQTRQTRQTRQRVVVVGPALCSPARQSLSGRKRLHRFTRILLSVLPRWVQSTLGYPVSSSIGCSLSPEVRVSPTKPCGKGSKRKQDELDEDDEEETQTWVEALNQQLADEDEGQEMDPDFEPSTLETESEEYCSQNNTDSDMELERKGLATEDLTNTSSSEETESAETSDGCCDSALEGKSIAIEDMTAGIAVSSEVACRAV